MAIFALDHVLFLVGEVSHLEAVLLLESLAAIECAVGEDEVVDGGLVVDVAGLFGFEYKGGSAESEVHVHEEGFDQFEDDFLVLAEQHLYWFFVDRLFAFEFFHKFFVSNEHLGLVDEVSDLDEDVVDEVEGDLLVVFVLDGGDPRYIYLF
jgi:hypothetical protein